MLGRALLLLQGVTRAEQRFRGPAGGRVDGPRPGCRVQPRGITVVPGATIAADAQRDSDRLGLGIDRPAVGIGRDDATPHGPARPPLPVRRRTQGARQPRHLHRTDGSSAAGALEPAGAWRSVHLNRSVVHVPRQLLAAGILRSGVVATGHCRARGCDDGQARVYLIRFDGDVVAVDPVREPHEVSGPAIAPDGRTMAWTSNCPEQDALFVYRAGHTVRVRCLTHFRSGDGSSPRSLECSPRTTCS